MSVNDYKYVWTVVTFSAYNTCKHTIFRCCFNLFLRRFALFCFAFDFVLPSTFWGFSLTIHSLPSPPLSLILSPSFTTTASLHFPSLPPPPFSRCLCLCRLHAECDGKLSIATWEGAYKLVTLSLSRFCSLSPLPPLSLLMLPPLSCIWNQLSFSCSKCKMPWLCLCWCVCVCVCVRCGK